MIYFSGGGIACDGETAFHPSGFRSAITGYGSGLYLANVPFYALQTAGGVMKQRKDNRFSDWDLVYVSYATGDLYTGNGKSVFSMGGKRRELIFAGRRNTEAVLEWARGNIGCPRKLLVCGESAGAFGSLFWLPFIAEAWPDCELYYLCDSAYIRAAGWYEISEDIWQSKFGSFFGYEPGADPVRTAFVENHKRLGGRVVMLHSNTLHDGVLASMQARVNGPAAGGSGASASWSVGMLENGFLSF